MSRKIVGAHEMHAIDGERSAAVVRTVRQTSPTMADALTDYAFGEIFARAELGRRECGSAHPRTAFQRGTHTAVGSVQVALRFLSTCTYQCSKMGLRNSAIVLISKL